MKKFKFKLEKLLDIRIAKEKEIQNELAGLMALQNRERVKQAELRKGMEEHQEKFQEKLRKGEYSLNENLIYEKYIDISIRAIDTAEEKIKSMEPAIQEIRNRLIEASKERRVVERLKERKQEEYNFELNREIAKENDDINSNIYNRKNKKSDKIMIGELHD